MLLCESVVSISKKELEGLRPLHVLEPKKKKKKNSERWPHEKGLIHHVGKGATNQGEGDLWKLKRIRKWIFPLASREAGNPMDRLMLAR